jgi:hypothetical protein
LSVLDNLLRNDVWLKQVLIVQSYTPTVSIQTGAYSATRKVGINIVIMQSNYAIDPGTSS